MTELLERLAVPFEPSYLSWKPGATKGDKCMALAFCDLRAYMERLDDVCGLDWAVAYDPWGDDRIICRLTIVGVTRSSTGEHDAQDEKNGMGGTVAEAQSFKRAAAMFGLGRFLYELPSVWIDFDATAKRISKTGQAELESRYKAWYNRTMEAQQKPATTPATQPDRDALGDVIFSRDEAGATPPAYVRPAGAPGARTHESPPHARLFGQGASIFGPDWDKGARAWLLMGWTGKVNLSEPRSSASQLSDDEKDLIADYLRDNVKTLQERWKKYKAEQIQPTVERQPQAA